MSTNVTKALMCQYIIYPLVGLFDS